MIFINILFFVFALVMKPQGKATKIHLSKVFLCVTMSLGITLRGKTLDLFSGH